VSKTKGETGAKGLLNGIPLLPLRIETPYEVTLGKLTIRFSWLHFVLEVFGWKLWKLEPAAGIVLTKDLQTKHLVEKLRQSAHLAIPKAADLEDFKSILKRVEKVAEKRNELLHSMWSFDSGSISRINRKRLTVKVVTSIDEINHLNNSITATIEELFNFEKREPLKSHVALALEEYIQRKKQKVGQHSGAKLVPKHPDAG
jgi:hypothetical protein